MSFVVLTYSWLECPNHIKQKITDFLWTCKTSLVSGTHRVFCLEVHGELVTILTLIIGESCIEIYDVNTRPDWRRLGCAMYLLSEAIRFCIQKMGYRNFWLGVEPNNFAAVKLYEKMGFRKLGMTTKTPSGKIRSSAFLELMGVFE